MNRPYDYWLLDLDGTLVDTEPSYVREAFDRVGDRLGRSFSDREATRLWHGLCDTRDDLLRELGVDPSAFWAAFDAVEDPTERAEATFLYPDADVVAGLDRPVGLVTHCQRDVLLPVLSRLDIRDWFDVVVPCDADLGWKPDPAPVYRAMAGLGVDDGHRGVLAGDGANDVGAAWNAGLDGIHVDRHGPERRGGCVLADHRVESLEGLGVCDLAAGDSAVEGPAAEGATVEESAVEGPAVEDPSIERRSGFTR